jgi:hypothetical protein
MSAIVHLLCSAGLLGCGPNFHKEARIKRSADWRTGRSMGQNWRIALSARAGCAFDRIAR